MKNIFKSLMLVAVAAMGFTACQKEGVEESTNNSVAESTYTMTFTAEAPESRTSVAIDGDVATYSWCEDDVVGFIQNAIGTDVNQCNKTNSESISIDGTKATFTTNFNNVANATTFNYGAFYPGASWVSTTDFNNVTVKINHTQTLTAGTFDHEADLMMSKPILNVTEKDGHGGNLQFTRLAAIGKMNLKGVTAGETINKVVITFEDAVVNGNVTLDFVNEAVTYAETDSHTITLKDGTLTAVEAGTPIFFTCFPGDYTGAYSVEVTTDVATYSTDAGKSIAEDKALSFTAGNVTNFNLTVGNRVVSNVEAYTKLTNVNLADYSGTYLLVYEDGNVAFDGSLTTLDAANNTINNFTIVDSTITGAYSAYTFTIAKVDGGYSIQSASGKFIGSTSTNDNKLNTATTYGAGYLNTIENLVIKGAGGAPLQYNSASDQNRFRYFYKAGQKAIALYRQNGTGSDEEIQYVDLATPNNLEATADGKVVTVTWDAVENATNYDVTANGNTTNVTTNSATLTLAYDTEYTISVVAKGGVGFNDSAAATTTVTTGEKPETGGGEETYSVTSFLTELGLSGTTTLNADTEYNIGDDIKMTVNKGNGSNTPAVNKDDELRIYASGGNMTLSSEKTITKVVFTFTSSSYAKITTANTGTYDTSTYTWTGSATSITFTNENTSGQARIKTMTITYNN